MISCWGESLRGKGWDNDVDDDDDDCVKKVAREESEEGERRSTREGG